jgi:UDPglucose 6-dehydrogenase
MRLSVIGLGKLGACIASVFAAKGFRVIGVDANENIVKSINDRCASFFEPKLSQYLTKAKKNLLATSDHNRAIIDSDVTFLVVPTPSLSSGHFSDKYLQEVLKKLSLILRESNKKHHLFVVVSTVSPGTISEKLIPLIEKYSRRKLNDGFSICYNPSFIALGNVIDNFLKPDMILIGEDNKTEGNHLETIYKRVCENHPYIARMSIISAEITKISLNSYITMKISFANTLANICEKSPEVDIDQITKALGIDRRIAPYYLKGGLSFGGPCFPRDNRAFVAFAKRWGIKAELALATDRINEFQIENIMKLIYANCPKQKNIKIAILGTAYKMNTPVIDDSPALKIIERLLRSRNMKIIVYDSLALESTKKYFLDNIEYATSVKKCLKDAALAVITLPYPEFQLIDNIKKTTAVIDCWRILDKAKLGNKVKYIVLGRHM